jgi:hypothetical protein
MRPPALAVCLAVLCVLAGCNAIAPGGTDGDGADADAPTVTPADVPRDMAGGTLAPGLTSDGVTDPGALVAAHRRALANESVTVELDILRRSNGTVVENSSGTYRFSADRERVALDAHIGASTVSPYDRVSRWSNGSVSYERIVVDDTTRYDRRSVDRGGETFLDYRAESLARAMDELRVDRVSYDGTVGGHRTYLVAGTIPGGGQACASDGGDVSVPVEFRFVVDARGVVRGHEQTRTHCRRTRAGPSNRTTVETTTYRAIGTTDVGVPDWVDDARRSIADREYVAPGVTAEGVVDAGAISRAHEAVARNTSLRVRRATVERRDGAVVSSERRFVAVDRTTDRVLTRRYDADRNVSGATWANGTVGYRRVVGVDGYQYTELRDPDARRIVDRYLAVPVPRSLEYADATVTSLGDDRYRVTARNLPVDVYSGRAYDRVSFVVEGSGLVTQFEAVGTRRDEPGTMTRRLTVVEAGTVSVERPDWVSIAANATGRP